jgi:tripeptide aminopeptidase
MDTARPTEDLKPKIKNDRIVSSGDTVLGVDNRAGVAVLLYLLRKAANDDVEIKDFTVAFTTCEETTLLGSKNLELNGKINKGFVFDSAYRPGSFINKACGAVGFKITINGRASHSGIDPEKGINAIDIAARAICNIRQGKIDEDTTLNIGKISGGSAVNVVPDNVLIEGEIRSFYEDRVIELIQEIKSKFDHESELSGGKILFDYDWDFKPFIIKEDSEVYRNTINVIRRVGLIPEPKTSLGGSDANSLNRNGIESVNLGIGAQNPHSNEEFILIEDLQKTAEIAFELIRLN